MKLFDYTIDEINEKIFELEKDKNNFIADLFETCSAIELLTLTKFDEFSIHRIYNELKERKKILSNAIMQCNSVISIYNEYIEAIKNYFNYNKPHEVYEEEAKILNISKYRKDK